MAGNQNSVRVLHRTHFSLAVVLYGCAISLTSKAEKQLMTSLSKPLSLVAMVYAQKIVQLKKPTPKKQPPDRLMGAAASDTHVHPQSIVPQLWNTRS